MLWPRKLHDTITTRRSGCFGLVVDRLSSEIGSAQIASQKPPNAPEQRNVQQDMDRTTKVTEAAKLPLMRLFGIAASKADPTFHKASTKF